MTMFAAPRFAFSARRPLTGANDVALDFPEDTLVVAIGDVHGQADGLEAALAGAARFHAPGKRRVLVLTGDLVDRGPDSLRVLRIVANAQTRYGFDSVVVLPGNHDLLMLDTMDSMLAGGSGGKASEVWIRNGGIPTLESVLGSGWAERLGTEGAARAFYDALPMWNDRPFRDGLRAAPSHLRLGDVVFVHAGLDPEANTFEETLAFPQDLHMSRDRAAFSGPSFHDVHWAWIREPFLSCEGGLKDVNGRHVLTVHGHTVARGADIGWLHDPDGALANGLDARARYGRVCIDGGSARGTLVAGAAISSEGIRFFAAPCSAP